MTIIKHISIEQIETILEIMKQAKMDHPKADVTYNNSSGQIEITYPLPRDFYKLSKLDESTYQYGKN